MYEQHVKCCQAAGSIVDALFNGLSWRVNSVKDDDDEEEEWPQLLNWKSTSWKNLNISKQNDTHEQ